GSISTGRGKSASDSCERSPDGSVPPDQAAHPRGVSEAGPIGHVLPAKSPGQSTVHRASRGEHTAGVAVIAPDTPWTQCRHRSNDDTPPSCSRASCNPVGRGYFSYTCGARVPMNGKLRYFSA